MKKCKVRGCNRKYSAKGFCQAHYRRDRRGMPLNKAFRRGRIKFRGCSVPKCSNEHYGLSLCHSHYNSRRTTTQASIIDAPECLVPNCGLTHMAKGMCAHHYFGYIRSNYQKISEYLLSITDYL